MPLPRPAQPDALRPTAAAAQDAWAARVRADRDQVNRCREVDDPTDFYGPVAERFRHDPARADDPVLRHLRHSCSPTDTWLDIGAGGGRYALPIALLTREVTCVEPSTGMLEVLRSGMRENAIENVRTVQDRWPIGGFEGAADVALVAHLGYDVEEIGPFVEAMETAARHRCIAVLAEGAMTTVGSMFWEPVHGERRVPLPGLPEFIGLLLARDHLPEIKLVDREPRTFDSVEDLLFMARRQLWVRVDSEKDRILQSLVQEGATERDGRWALDWSTSRIGIVSWEPVED
jgi:SAM-dependent methyltransferase